jgi:cytochrome c5
MRRFSVGVFAFLITALVFAEQDADSSVVERRLQPVGSVQVEGDASVDATAEPKAQPINDKAESAVADAELSDVADGKKIYTSYCAVCHAAGVAGAPKFRDEASWGARAKKPMSELVKSVNSGLNAMPPKGMCTNCTDEEFVAAISYMLPQGE